jgi:aspartate-semialdehyde dehydrogenase
VRVPIVGGHSEAVNVEFSNDFSFRHSKFIAHCDGVVVQDNTIPIRIQCQCMHKEKMMCLWVEYVAMKVRLIH